MFGDRFSSSTSCSKWRRETKPGRLDQSRSCYFLKVATHPIQHTPQPEMDLRRFTASDRTGPYERHALAIVRMSASSFRVRSNSRPGCYSIGKGVTYTRGRAALA